MERNQKFYTVTVSIANHTVLIMKDIPADTDTQAEEKVSQTMKFSTFLQEKLIGPTIEDHIIEDHIAGEADPFLEQTLKKE